MKIEGIDVKIKELARLLGVHPNTIARRVRENRLPPVITEYYSLLAIAVARVKRRD
jgi:plasmid maintenance system antidote protein VapI